MYSSTTVVDVPVDGTLVSLFKTSLHVITVVTKNGVNNIYNCSISGKLEDIYQYQDYEGSPSRYYYEATFSIIF